MIIAVWSELGAIAGAVAALAGLVTIIYKVYFSPRAKARRQALKNGQKAVKNDNTSGITAFFSRIKRK